MGNASLDLTALDPVLFPPESDNTETDVIDLGDESLDLSEPLPQSHEDTYVLVEENQCLDTSEELVEETPPQAQVMEADATGMGVALLAGKAMEAVGDYWMGEGFAGGFSTTTLMESSGASTSGFRLFPQIFRALVTGMGETALLPEIAAGATIAYGAASGGPAALFYAPSKPNWSRMEAEGKIMGDLNAVGINSYQFRSQFIGFQTQDGTTLTEDHFQNLITIVTNVSTVYEQDGIELAYTAFNKQLGNCKRTQTPDEVWATAWLWIETLHPQFKSLTTKEGVSIGDEIVKQYTLPGDTRVPGMASQSPEPDEAELTRFLREGYMLPPEFRDDTSIAALLNDLKFQGELARLLLQKQQLESLGYDETFTGNITRQIDTLIQSRISAMPVAGPVNGGNAGSVAGVTGSTQVDDDWNTFRTALLKMDEAFREARRLGRSYANIDEPLRVVKDYLAKTGIRDQVIALVGNSPNNPTWESAVFTYLTIPQKVAYLILKVEYEGRTSGIDYKQIFDYLPKTIPNYPGTPLPLDSIRDQAQQIVQGQRALTDPAALCSEANELLQKVGKGTPLDQKATLLRLEQIRDQLKAHLDATVYAGEEWIRSSRGPDGSTFQLMSSGRVVDSVHNIIEALANAKRWTPDLMTRFSNLDTPQKISFILELDQLSRGNNKRYAQAYTWKIEVLGYLARDPLSPE
ncbi:hypothetical protein K1X76_10130 [bacterium]|nr:hypothetical protein [bacterium]